MDGIIKCCRKMSKNQNSAEEILVFDVDRGSFFMIGATTAGAVCGK